MLNAFLLFLCYNFIRIGDDMRKKGFTLIELLAVIVILAILALILMPMIQELILNARKSTFERSIDGILAAAEYYQIENPNSESITFTCDGTSCEDSNGNKLEFKGEVPISGTITISETGVVAENLCNQSFCGSGSRQGLAVSIGGGIATSSCDKYFAIVTSGTAWEYDFLTNNDVQTIYNFDYTGGEQKFIVPTTGTYVIETWGAEGGSYNETYHGGYGGYSKGIINLSKGMVLYVNVGGQGTGGPAHQANNMGGGGYNGGGDRSGWSGCSGCNYQAYGGGGATHIATVSGELSSLEAYKGVLSNDEKYYISNEIIMVAGGGGGNGYTDSGNNTNFTGIASGGGYKGVYGNTYHGGEAGVIGTQTSGNSFGLGRSGTVGVDDGGGGGFYGGHWGFNGGAGGSGYIANPSLSDKAMYCYDCEESSETNIYTISTTGDNKDSSSCPNGYASSPTTNCAKSGNGYARITLLNADTKCNPSSINSQGFIVPNTGNYKLEVWGAQGGSYTETYHGGYGGYSVGEISLETGKNIYIYIGGAGKMGARNEGTILGGYNGGGDAYTDSDGDNSLGSGGGATHIALNNFGELKNYAEHKDDILIVAGGGGGATDYYSSSRQYAYGSGGSGGGFEGANSSTITYSLSSSRFSNESFGGTQTNSGLNGNVKASWGTLDTSTTAMAFGRASTIKDGDYAHSGGGGGYYGGGNGFVTPGAGGSGYIGHNGLTNAKMFCYNCTEDKVNASTYTESTTCTELNPTSECAKQGNGYARITYLGN